MPSTIKLGSTGADVATWQGLLTSAGFPTAITSTFGAETDTQTRNWQSAKGLQVDGIVGPASWSAMTGKSQPAGHDKNAAFGRAALLEAWSKVTGQQPNLAELQIAGAQAHLESNYGKASYKLLDHATGATLATSGPINNWGAVQTSEGPPNGFLATDTSPNKKTADNPKGYYDHHYKVYPTPAAGAEHFVAHMTIKRPTSWALMKKGDIDAWARQMHSYNPPGSKTLNPDPITGTFGYFEQHPDSRAKGIEQRIAAIAATLGEPIAAKRGGPMPEGAIDPAPVPPGLDAISSAVFPEPTESKLPAAAKRGAAVALLGGAAWALWKLWKGGF